jgi:hypothetical protein
MHKHARGQAIKLASRYRVPRRKTNEAIHAFLCGLNTPRSLAVWLLYENREHQQLVDLEVKPEDYLETCSFRADYAATKLLSKSDFLKLDVDRKQVALSSFYKSEELCSLTNSRFRDLSLDPSFKGSNVWLLNATQRKIDSVLGEFSPEEWFELCSWGPGSTFHLGGSDTSSVNKFRCESGITSELHTLVHDLIPVAYPLWGGLLTERGYNFTPGNKITNVPKNAKTDRVIAIEPGLNVFFQLGLGKMISRRLLRSEGIDLRTQDRNGLLAFYGSMTGQLATIDFTSASDLISREVVRELIPARWFQVMECCRSPSHRRDDKEWYRTEKFSSMGNGFTFPLQSLIFASAAISVCEYLGIGSEYVGVFGDDVIVPESAYSLFLEFCNFLGFMVNSSKSYSSGYFRESCGTHYFKGLDVKPIFLKKALSNVQSLFRFANSVRRLAHVWGVSLSCDARFRHCWALTRSWIPKELRFTIPEGYGDGGLVSNFDEASPSIQRAEGQVEGYFYLALVDIGVERDSFGPEILLDRLFNTSTLDPFQRINTMRQIWFGSRIERNNNYALRAVTRIRISRSLTPKWCNLGPWV